VVDRVGGVIIINRERWLRKFFGKKLNYNILEITLNNKLLTIGVLAKKWCLPNMPLGRWFLSKRQRTTNEQTLVYVRDYYVMFRDYYGIKECYIISTK
jgi:hypothetical protein